MTIEIQVQGGKVTIHVGGKTVSNNAANDETANDETANDENAQDGTALDEDANGEIANQDFVGAGLDDTSSGGSVQGSGTVVIGPIVVDCSCPQHSGGTKRRSGLDDTSSGGNAAGSGALVIGPIVVCGKRGGGGKAEKTPSRPVAVNPPARARV